MVELDTDGGPTRQTILDAAGARFAHFGFQKTSMGDIASEANVARATLYLHFRGKEALYSALLEREIAALVDGIEAIVVDDAPAPVKLRRIVQAMWQAYGDNPVLLGALKDRPEMASDEVADDVMLPQEERITGLLRTVLEQGVTEGSLRPIDPTAVAYLMYKLGNVLLVREATGRGDFALADILGAMDDVVAHGILARDA